MAARYQRQEVAVLASRGSGRLQILGLKLVETCIILVLAIPLGVAGGMLLARLIGYVRGFMAFGPRVPFAVHLQSADWRLVAAAAGLSIVAQLWPHLSASRLTIVTYERWSARRSVAQSGARLLATVLLMVASAYAYRRLVADGGLTLIGLRSGQQALDPLPLVAPSLFLFTVSLAASQLFVLLVRPMALLGKLLPSVSAYLGCTVLGREGEQYRAPIYLIVLCLSLGVFFASLGKSADQWLLDRRAYEVGADLTVALDLLPPGQALDPRSAAVAAQSGPQESAVHSKVLLLPIDEYESVPGVAVAARVGEFRASIAAARLPDVRLMAVDRLDFSQVLYYRADYAGQPLGELMNRLGAQPDAVLIPAKLAGQLQIAPGDKLVLSVRIDQDAYQTLPFTVMGLFSYFPTMYEEQTMVVVGNMDYLQTELGGAVPYRVWMRIERGADTGAILQGIKDLGVQPLVIGDRAFLVSEDQRRLERVGMFGMLSFCFLASAALAGLGLLVHRFASLFGQRVRYAVWQAIGMSRREIIAAASVEYLLTLGYGIVLGAGGGFAASLLYVPLYRLTDQMERVIPPFIPMVNWAAGIWIVIALALAFVLIEATTMVTLSRMRIFEALRMGNRE